ncbi:tetratricopeptide repeat protein 22 [Acipenser ruthenus]|uniref:tetratricopeptide repeat protein 22 n=1 Tax=Acipenser ruthenus TaxID=7906 RepID=UPI002741A7BF|nr:tetratricopeptide repeat protein 22 [Acipenser ruthenus]
MEESSADTDIETLIDEMDYIPGHFHLELNLNCESLTPAKLRRRDMVLKRDSLQSELESETGSQQFAVRNLLGLFAFHLEELSLAEETFLNICKEDPRNLNAWANLGYVYDRLKKEPEGAETVEKVFGLMGMGAGEAGEVEPRLQAARCLAEQAYAHAYDVGLNTEQEHLEKLITAVNLYDKAIAYGGQEIPLEEKRSWYFIMATMHVRLDGMLKDQEDSEHKRMTSFSRTVKLLHEAMKSSNPHYKALAWCYIGLMLERQDTFPVVPMGIHDCGYSGTDPLDCYCKAIETAKESPFILNRLAKVFLFLGKMDMATGICNMALDILPDPELNWQAYCTRAKVYITTYVKDLEQAKLGLAGVPDRENLSKAKTDLEHILQACPCLKTYMDIGQVYYYMGVDAMQERLLVDEAAINTALVSFAKAMELELGDTLPELQLLRGKCLLLKGEEQNAAECFKRAMELEESGSAHAEGFRCLLETLLTLFIQRKLDPGAAITEVEECMRRAEERHRPELVKQELQLLCRTHTADISELSRAMIRAGKLELVRRLLETMQPGQKKQLGRSYSL